jgi:hypothetical protein
MKFIKKKKTAAAEVSSSINSETDALAMSSKVPTLKIGKYLSDFLSI